jgi:hypothetical protein
LASPLAIARSEGGLEIRAAAWWRDRLIALTASAAEPAQYALHYLDVGADGVAVLGDGIGPALPSDFVPVEIAATGEVLWVGGAIDHLASVVTVDNRIDDLPEGLRELTSEEDLDPAIPAGVSKMEVRQSKPGLVRISDDSVELADFPIPTDIQSGVVSSVDVSPDGVLGIVIDGCDDPDMAMVTRSHVAVSYDGGSTWDSNLLADDIGEAYGSALVAVDRSFFSITSTGRDAQIISRAPDLDMNFEVIATTADAGAPISVGTAAGGQLVVFTKVDDEIAEHRYSDGHVSTAKAPELAAGCGCAGHLVTVRGGRSEWLEAEGSTLTLMER